MTDPYAPFFIVTSEPDLDSKRFNTLEEAVVWAALDHYAESYCLEIHADYQRPISNFMGMFLVIFLIVISTFKSISF